MGACFVYCSNLFVISTSVIDCLGRFVPEMTYYVSTQLNWYSLCDLCLPIEGWSLVRLARFRWMVT